MGGRKKKSQALEFFANMSSWQSDMEIYNITFCLPHTITERFANIQSVAIVDNKKKCTS